MFEEGSRGRVDQMLYNGEGRLTLLIAFTVMCLKEATMVPFFFNQTEMVV